MQAKITVNGITYDSVDAMPPEARQLYEQTLARLPELTDRDADGIPDIVQKEGLSVQHSTKVRQKFIVNGKTYENMESMPLDVRETCEQAMRAARAGEPTVKKNEIKMSFTVSGPGLRFSKTFGAPGAPSPENQAVGPTSAQQPVARMTSSPIEPASTENSVRVALIVGACGIIGIVLWFLTRPH